MRLKFVLAAKMITPGQKLATIPPFAQRHPGTVFSEKPSLSTRRVIMVTNFQSGFKSKCIKSFGAMRRALTLFTIECFPLREWKRVCYACGQFSLDVIFKTLDTIDAVRDRLDAVMGPMSAQRAGPLNGQPKNILLLPPNQLLRNSNLSNKRKPKPNHKSKGQKESHQKKKKSGNKRKPLRKKRQQKEGH